MYRSWSRFFSLLGNMHLRVKQTNLAYKVYIKLLVYAPLYFQCTKISIKRMIMYENFPRHNTYIEYSQQGFNNHDMLWTFTERNWGWGGVGFKGLYVYTILFMQTPFGRSAYSFGFLSLYRLLRRRVCI